MAASVAHYFQDLELKELSIDIDVIRPGLFWGNPGKSDGTVVAMASTESASKLLSVSSGLADHLSGAHPNWFPQSAQRPMPGIWCTLRYFDEPDFDIDAKLHDALAPYRIIAAKLSVQELTLTEFTVKSLADGIPRTRITLCSA